MVVGFFALLVMATVLQNLFGYQTRLNAFVAGIALGFAVIPIVFSIAEDALTSVPHSYTQAALALGASRWQTAWQIVLPAALPGVFAAVVLGFGRAIGETMIVLHGLLGQRDVLEPLRFGPQHHHHHRCRNGRGGGGRPSLPHSVHAGRACCSR